MQAMVQSTPALVASFPTVAMRFAVSPFSAAPSVTAVGETLILIAGLGVTVMLALTETLGSLMDVAAIVTGPEGEAGGAIYVVDAPVTLLNVPQAPCAELPQVAVQETPPFALSLAIRTLKVACCPACNVVTGGVVNVIEIDGALIVSVTLLVAEGLLVTDAVMVTLLPIGTLAGAVKTDGAPPAVCTGDSVPHAPPVMEPVTGLPPQVAAQSTPPPIESFTGAIVRVALPLTGRDKDCPLPEALPIVTTIGPAVTRDPLLHPVITGTHVIRTQRTKTHVLRTSPARSRLALSENINSPVPVTTARSARSTLARLSTSYEQLLLSRERARLTR
jgi:hypothetical protein